jgi:hypothetical protein
MQEEVRGKLNGVGKTNIHYKNDASREDSLNVEVHERGREGSKEIHSLYRLHFENDLQFVKDRTDEQVINFKYKLDQSSMLMDAMRTENEQLRRLIKTTKERIENYNHKVAY